MESATPLQLAMLDKLNSLNGLISMSALIDTLQDCLLEMAGEIDGLKDEGLSVVVVE